MSTPLNRKSILDLYGHACERLVRESERLLITSISRSKAFELEKVKQFPARKKLGNSSCAWLLSDLLLWCHGLWQE